MSFSPRSAITYVLKLPTQLFTNYDEVNSTIETRETHSFDNDDLKEEIFSDSESESKDDLEIPAFLRRQTN